MGYDTSTLARGLKRSTRPKHNMRVHALHDHLVRRPTTQTAGVQPSEAAATSTTSSEAGEVVAGRRRLRLVCGDKAYSSWSLRAWLPLRIAAGVGGFAEINIELAGAGSDAQRDYIRKYSPSGKVPALIDEELGGQVIWDSLAIAEYIHEIFPAAQLWPVDPAERAKARAVSAEMHSGFAAMREALPMNVRRHSPESEAWRAPGVEADIARVCEIWAECRAGMPAERGPFLFGGFTIADAMYAPVCMRFRTYEPPLDAVSRAYVDAVSSMPEMDEWVAAADAETHRITQYEC
jgi:glutathione S-transferase